MQNETSIQYKWEHACAALFAALLLLTLAVPATHALWVRMDVGTFYALNGILLDNPTAQAFWAFLSTKMFDISAAIFMVLPFIYYMRSNDVEVLAERVAQGIYLAIVLTATILISKELSVGRQSPSFILSPLIDISFALNFAQAKVFSSSSFPSDHGIATMLLTVFYWRFAGKKYGLFMGFLVVLFCLPRLVAGAHWFTDIAAGSVIITLIVSSVFIKTPVETWGLAKCRKITNHSKIRSILKRVFFIK